MRLEESRFTDFTTHAFSKTLYRRHYRLQIFPKSKVLMLPFDRSVPSGVSVKRARLLNNPASSGKHLFLGLVPLSFRPFVDGESDGAQARPADKNVNVCVRSKGGGGGSGRYWLLITNIRKRAKYGNIKFIDVGPRGTRRFACLTEAPRVYLFPVKIGFFTKLSSTKR